MMIFLIIVIVFCFIFNKNSTLNDKNDNLSSVGTLNQETADKESEIFYDELCPRRKTEYPDYTDIVFSKADKSSKLPDDFIPKNLKNIEDLGVKGSEKIICLRLDVFNSLKNMFADAKKDDINLAITSGFRTAEYQKWLVDYYIEKGQLNGIALPGYSEHQLGTAVDLTGSSIKYKSTDDNFYKTVEYKWLQKNASKYGFFLSYPIGNPDYKFEPWHWRFWGINE